MAGVYYKWEESLAKVTIGKNDTTLYIYGTLVAEQYQYMEDLRRLDSCRPRQQSVPTWMMGVITPLKWRAWEVALARHPDHQFRDYIVNGIKDGFRIGFDYNRKCKPIGKNMRSAKQNPTVVTDYLLTECAAGRVVGPVGWHMFPPESIQINQFGVIPKSTPGKWRLIVDLSSPEGLSVNDGVDTELCSLQYVKVEDAAREVVKQGHNIWMAKVDIQQAYRNVPIHPQDRWLLGMTWEGKVFIDTTMPFGVRSAPKIFTALADAVEWVLKERGVKFVIHYLDDFLLVGGTDHTACVAQMRTILDTFEELGLPVAMNKLEGPTSCLTFLGFELDTVAMELRLPQTKLEELRREIQL